MDQAALLSKAEPGQQHKSYSETNSNAIKETITSKQGFWTEPHSYLVRQHALLHQQGSDGGSVAICRDVQRVCSFRSSWAWAEKWVKPGTKPAWVAPTPRIAALRGSVPRKVMPAVKHGVMLKDPEPGVSWIGYQMGRAEQTESRMNTVGVGEESGIWFRELSTAAVALYQHLSWLASLRQVWCIF